MKRRQGRLERLNAVEREFLAAQFALKSLEESLRADPSLLNEVGLSRNDAKHAMNNLEATFLLRLFAEFEAGLREVWRHALSQRSEPRTRDLLDGIAARRQVAEDLLDSVHDVREYRNQLVHEDGGAVRGMPLPEAKRWLGTFFSRMPLDW